MALPVPRAAHVAALVLAIAAFAVSLTVTPAQSLGDSGCTRVAAPHGSDDADGTDAQPYRSLEQLVDSLRDGEVGCLRAGTYGGGSVYFEAAHAELRSYPGETATITAFLEVKPEAVGAHVHHLRFDASHHSNNTGVKLQADGTRFSDNELTKGGRGICLLAGSYHPAAGIVIERNRIYDCGPSSSKLMHQIYLQNTRGAVVRWNILTGNDGGWGVHLYANADDSLIEHNIIDGNHGGVIFAGTSGDTSDRNVVRNNAITYSGPRWNIEGSWSDDPPGNGNSAHHNCVYSSGEDAPTGIGYEHGFDATANTTVTGSPYADRGRGDYRLDPASACGQLVGDVVGAIAGVPSAAPAPAPPAQQRARAARRPAALGLRASRHRVRPNRRVRLHGRLRGARPADARTVVLQIRQRGRWRRIDRAVVRRGGRFSRWIRTGRSPRVRTSRMRAIVPRVAHSRTLRLRVGRTR